MILWSRNKLKVVSVFDDPFELKLIFSANCWLQCHFQRFTEKSSENNFKIFLISFLTLYDNSLTLCISLQFGFFYVIFYILAGTFN